MENSKRIEDLLADRRARFEPEFTEDELKKYKAQLAASDIPRRPLIGLPEE